jgi:Rha family phage regulatory protein
MERMYAVCTPSVFGKQHAHVLRSIRELLAELPEDRRSNFGLTFAEVAGPKGAVRREAAYTITRDGFTLLAMGFTGRR